MAKSDKDWDQRVLCSDGNCIGIIGADGRCKLCGLPYDGELASSVEAVDGNDDGLDNVSENAHEIGDADHFTEDAQHRSDAPDDAWEQRTLCIDESCIGVVGPNGRCNECGKPYPG